jgi:site-specific recombinase XerD
VQAAIRHYLHQLKFDQEASEHTLQAYQTDLQQFLAVITTQAGSAITPNELNDVLIRRYSEWLSAQGYRPTTISRKFAALRSFLQYLGELGYEGLSGIAQGLHVPYEPRKVPRMLDGDELVRLLEAPRAHQSPGSLRDAAILALLYESGFRATELVKLRLADVQLNQARIRHPSNLAESVSIPASVESIRNYLQESRPHLVRDPLEDTLFLNQRGKGLTRQGLWLVVKRWAATAAIPGSLSPHTLRHTRARDLLQRGVNRREVQRFLGLSSPNAIRIHSKKPKNED